MDGHTIYHPTVAAMYGFLLGHRHGTIRTIHRCFLSQTTEGRYARCLSSFYYWLENNTPGFDVIPQGYTRRGQTRRTALYSRIDVNTMKSFLESTPGGSKSQYLQYFYAVVWDACIRQEYLSAEFRIGVLAFILTKHRRVIYGCMKLVVLLIRARKRAMHRLYSPGGKGYEICQQRYHDNVSKYMK